MAPENINESIIRSSRGMEGRELETHQLLSPVILRNMSAASTPARTQATWRMGVSKSRQTWYQKRHNTQKLERKVFLIPMIVVSIVSKTLRMQRSSKAQYTRTTLSKNKKKPRKRKKEKNHQCIRLCKTMRPVRLQPIPECVYISTRVV